MIPKQKEKDFYSKEEIDEKIYSNMKIHYLGSKYMVSQDFTIDMSKYSQGLVYVHYQPDGTNVYSSLLGAFSKRGDNVYCYEIAEHHGRSEAKPSFSFSGTSITIVKGSWGGNCRVYFIGV